MTTILNIGLNYLLISKIGILGAALATLISQSFSILILLGIFKGTRNIFKNLIKGLLGIDIDIKSIFAVIKSKFSKKKCEVLNTDQTYDTLSKEIIILDDCNCTKLIELDTSDEILIDSKSLNKADTNNPKDLETNNQELSADNDNNTNESMSDDNTENDVKINNIEEEKE